MTKLLKITVCLIIIAFCSYVTVFTASGLFVFMDIDAYEPGLLGYTVGSILILFVILVDVFYIYRLIGYFRRGKSYIVIYILSLVMIFVSFLSVVILYEIRPATSPSYNARNNQYEHAMQFLKSAAETYFISSGDYKLNGTVTSNNTSVRIGTEILNSNNESLLYFEPEVLTNTINICNGNDQKVEPLLTKGSIDNINKRYIKMMVLKSSKYEGKKHRYDESKEYKFFYIVEPDANSENLKDKLYIVLIDGDRPLYDTKSKRITNALKTIRFN